MSKDLPIVMTINVNKLRWVLGQIGEDELARIMGSHSLLINWGREQKSGVSFAIENFDTIETFMAEVLDNNKNTDVKQYFHITEEEE